MYYYIVDTTKISTRQFERVQQQLYSSISDYKINGEIVRTTGIRTVKQLVETAFFHQANTIVAVGTDETLNQVINFVGPRPICIGFLPLVKTEMSEALGTTGIDTACKSLAVRRVEDMDLGAANGNNFLSKLNFGIDFAQAPKFDLLGMGFVNKITHAPAFEIKFKADNYQGQAEIIGGLIINCQNHGCDDTLGNPSDGLLDLVLVPKLSRVQAIAHKNHLLSGCFEKIPGVSIIHFENFEIHNPLNLSFKNGSEEFTSSPAKISARKHVAKIIVGRGRKF